MPGPELVNFVSVHTSGLSSYLAALWVVFYVVVKQSAEVKIDCEVCVLGFDIC